MAPESTFVSTGPGVARWSSMTDAGLYLHRMPTPLPHAHRLAELLAIPLDDSLDAYFHGTSAEALMHLARRGRMPTGGTSLREFFALKSSYPDAETDAWEKYAGPWARCHPLCGPPLNLGPHEAMRYLEKDINPIPNLGFDLRRQKGFVLGIAGGPLQGELQFEDKSELEPDEVVVETSGFRIEWIRAIGFKVETERQRLLKAVGL